MYGHKHTAFALTLQKSNADIQAGVVRLPYEQQFGRESLNLFDRGSRPRRICTYVVDRVWRGKKTYIHIQSLRTVWARVERTCCSGRLLLIIDLNIKMGRRDERNLKPIVDCPRKTPTRGSGGRGRQVGRANVLHALVVRQFDRVSPGERINYSHKSHLATDCRLPISL